PPPFYSSYAVLLRTLHSLPTRRSSDLLQFAIRARHQCSLMHSAGSPGALNLAPESVFDVDSAEKRTFPCFIANPDSRIQRPDPEDRKSTRLNSSHLVISYAVFCLKKKT